MSETGPHSPRLPRLYRVTSCVIFLSTLVCLAWYAWTNHKLLKEYQAVRDKFAMSDAEMADFGEHQREYVEAMKRQDEMSALIALAALVKLDEGDLEKAKWRPRTAISIYYREHKFDGNSNLLRQITTYASTNPPLSNAIYGKLD